MGRRETKHKVDFRHNSGIGNWVLIIDGVYQVRSDIFKADYLSLKGNWLRTDNQSQLHRWLHAGGERGNHYRRRPQWRLLRLFTALARKPLSGIPQSSRKWPW